MPFETWQIKNGPRVSVATMDKEHIANAARWMLRQSVSVVCRRALYLPYPDSGTEWKLVVDMFEAAWAGARRIFERARDEELVPAEELKFLWLWEPLHHEPEPEDLYYDEELARIASDKPY